MRQVKAAVVGCGSISDIYMQNLSGEKFEIIDLVACSDAVPSRMEASASKFGIRAMTLEEICASPEIEMVINLTTPLAHYEVTRACLLAGKHVFSEKMIAVELEQGRELLRIADARGLRLGVAPDTFLGASIQTAKYIVDAGLIGEPVSCRASVSRCYEIFGEFLTHLNRRGAGIGFDMGGYYLTALASILGPAQSIAAFSRIRKPERVNTRVGAPGYGQTYTIEAPNVITAAVRYRSGVQGTIHMNGDSLLDEKTNLEIYGTEGILTMGDPNLFGGQLTLKRTMGDEIAFPFTHGYAENSRGLGAAEMAWSIVKDRPHRASKEMAFHVFEMMHGMLISAERNSFYEMESSFTTPEALPAGYIGSGNWTRREESALSL